MCDSIQKYPTQKKDTCYKPQHQGQVDKHTLMHIHELWERLRLFHLVYSLLEPVDCALDNKALAYNLIAGNLTDEIEAQVFAL
jgi:hypothetical protein